MSKDREPIEAVYALLHSNPDGTEGIVAIGIPPIPCVFSETARLPQMEELMEHIVRRGMVARLIKFHGREVIKEVHPK